MFADEVWLLKFPVSLAAHTVTVRVSDPARGPGAYAGPPGRSEAGTTVAPDSQFKDKFRPGRGKFRTAQLAVTEGDASLSLRQPGLSSDSGLPVSRSTACCGEPESLESGRSAVSTRAAATVVPLSSTRAGARASPGFGRLHDHLI